MFVLAVRRGTVRSFHHSSLEVSESTLVFYLVDPGRSDNGRNTNTSTSEIESRFGAVKPIRVGDIQRSWYMIVETTMLVIEHNKSGF